MSSVIHRGHPGARDGRFGCALALAGVDGAAEGGDADQRTGFAARKKCPRDLRALGRRGR